MSRRNDLYQRCILGTMVTKQCQNTSVEDQGTKNGRCITKHNTHLYHVTCHYELRRKVTYLVKESGDFKCIGLHLSKRVKIVPHLCNTVGAVLKK